MHERTGPRARGLFGGDAGTVDVNGPEAIAGLGDRHECHVVMHDVDATHRCSDAGAIEDVATDELSLLRSPFVLPKVENPNLVAPFDQPAGDCAA